MYNMKFIIIFLSLYGYLSYIVVALFPLHGTLSYITTALFATAMGRTSGRSLCIY